jgi:acetoin:2,6-dichlorophenolindophenol oxidoreductase subunit alpha
MLQTIVSQQTEKESVLRREAFLKAYRWMLLTRVLEDKLASLYRGGKIHGGVYLGRGQEALSVAIGLSLQKGDVFAPLIRDQAGRLAFGESLIDGIRTYLGSPAGPMRSRDGNVHRGRPKEGILPMLSHLGSTIAVVNGILFARRLKGIRHTVGVASLGDGGSSTGAFHEALNQAAIEKLPLVLVIANNQYAYSTPCSRQYACASLVDRAVGYGVEGHQLDGTDLAACLRVVGEAVRQAREGKGPQLVVAELLRLCGHGEHDDAGYVEARLKQSAIGRDCLSVAKATILARQWAGISELDGWRQEVVQVVEDTVIQVQHEPAPDPYQEDWTVLASKHLTEMVGWEPGFA